MAKVAENGSPCPRTIPVKTDKRLSFRVRANCTVSNYDENWPKKGHR